MKRCLSVVLAVFLLFSCLITGVPEACASAKGNDTRAIAIVFDNSGSMYERGNQAWCRATYAMEVFASMLNTGDVLQIYPMCPITAGGREYTMEEPLQITDAAQAYMIRDIFTEDAGGTPIESIDYAISGLQLTRADSKYLIVLTDGGSFSKKGGGLSKSRTKSELDKRIKAQAGKDMTIMYLGIGSEACIPDTEQSEYFVKRQAADTEEVLATLTELCNQVFGRDTLPKSRISGRTISFDISMSKLIVFVQGEDITDLRLSGVPSGQLTGTQQTQYSTKGAGDYKSVPDTSLQGMMVTYEDCAAGSYDIEYTGSATSVEVYYEPDAALDFVFTDAAGNTVDPDALYEGDYRVSFGMKDARTGRLIDSDLLGSPHYQGSYSIDGKSVSITHDGFSGSVDVPLKMGERFEAELTVTYLSGYTISKNTSDFGWPEGGIQVTARPAGELLLEISGGDTVYSLQDLEEGTPYTAKVYYQGAQLTGDELERVELRWEPETSNAEIKKTFADDHWALTLHYKDPTQPQDTVCGECTVTIYALYTAQGSDEAQTQSQMAYNIEDDFSPLRLELDAPESYIVIKELADSREIIARLSIGGAPLSDREIAATQLQIDCGGINYTVTPCEEDSCYRVKLLPTEGIGEGNYPISVTARYTDHIGREVQAKDQLTVTLSNTPLWVRWGVRLLVLVVLIVVLWVILHIRVLPKYANTSRRLSTLNFDGDDVTQATNFSAEIRKRGAKVQAQYAGKKFGVAMDVTPGKESYLYKPQKRRSAAVKAASVRKFGPARIQEVMIGSAKYIADETSGKLTPALANQKMFMLTNGMMIKFSGTIQDAGVDKDFEVTSKLNFRKK